MSPEVNMSKSLATFFQKDVFPSQNDNWEDLFFEDRLTGKAIVFDNEDKIALVGTKVNSLYQLPGGGIDSNESIEEGVIRECLEEIGCKVTLFKKIGVIDDYRNRDKKHCINHCYAAKLVGEKGIPTLTEDEAKNRLHVVWVSLDEAVKIFDKEVLQLKKGEILFYNTGYNILRDSFFLKEMQKNIQ